MKRSFRVLLAAVAVLAALCSCAWAVGPTKVTPDTKDWKADDSPYYVEGDVTISGRITVTGTVVLELRDGCTLNATEGITVNKGNSLTINGGTEGTGELVATSNHNKNAAIGGAESDAGKITINGGVVTANGDSGSTSAAIGGGYEGSGGEITINGGVVTAMNVQGGDNKGAAIGSGYSNGGAVSGGAIKITGGKVTAHALNGAAIGGGAPESSPSDKISGGTISITGGNISAESDNGDGIGCGDGVSSTGSDRGTLSSDANGTAWIVAKGKDRGIGAKTDDFKSGVTFDGDVSKVWGKDQIISGDVEIPAGKKLTVPSGQSLTIPKGMSMAMLDGSALTIETGAKLKIEADAKFDATNGTVDNKGTIENEGAMDAGTKGKIVNSGTILNKGEMGAADGTIENSGTIENEADAKLDATAGKIVNTGTINNKGTMDAASDAIDNKGTILNDGTLNLPEGTGADVIKALNLTGSGKVMAGEKEYGNDGTSADGGDDDDPIIPDVPKNVEDFVSTDKMPELADPEKITSGDSAPIKDVAAVETAAPTLIGAVTEAKTPYGSAPTVSSDVAVELATEILVKNEIIAPESRVSSEDITFMPVRSVDVTEDRPDAVIIFHGLKGKHLLSSNGQAANIVVLKVKSSDLAQPVAAAIDPTGADFENGKFMITDEDNTPVSTIDLNGTYNLLVRVTDLKDGEKDIDDPTNFDVNDQAGTVVDPIIIVKEPKGSDGSSGGACATGAAAVVALSCLAMIKRRTR